MSPPPEAILLVDNDILVRHPLADYLRDCGFLVFEAASQDEAKHILSSGSVPFGAVLADMETAEGGFAFRVWARQNFPEIEVILAGTVDRSVTAAAHLCHEGPNLAKPYQHHLVLDHIRQSLARRDRGE